MDVYAAGGGKVVGWPMREVGQRSMLLMSHVARDKSQLFSEDALLIIINVANMRGIKTIVTAALAGGAAALVVQKPLLESDSKPLVDSKKLQSSIDGETLLSRAEDLYKLAELSWQYV